MIRLEHRRGTCVSILWMGYTPHILGTSAWYYALFGKKDSVPNDSSFEAASDVLFCLDEQSQRKNKKNHSAYIILIFFFFFFVFLLLNSCLFFRVFLKFLQGSLFFNFFILTLIPDKLKFFFFQLIIITSLLFRKTKQDMNEASFCALNISNF